MSHSGGMIYNSVGIVADLQAVLGTSEYRQSYLCTHANINKWAWYKPIRLNKQQRITESDRSSVAYGLVITRNTKAEQILKNTSLMTEANFADACSATYEWTYNRPRGGAYNEPYRLGDFLSEPSLARGYKHNSEAPITLTDNWDIDKAVLSKAVNTYGVESVSGATYEQGLTIYATKSTSAATVTGVIFDKYKARFGTGSNEQIGGPDTLTIPVTSLMSAYDGAWRMGIMVYIPAYSGNASRIELFVSKGLIKNVSQQVSDIINAISVQLCSNQAGARHILGCMGNNTSKDFRALPVLVKNVSFTAGVSIDSYITYNNALEVYTMPTFNNGTYEMKLKITSDVPYVDGITTYPDSATADNIFIVGMYLSGTSGSLNIYRLAIFLCTGKSFTGSKTLSYNVTYSYGVGSSRTTTTVTGTASIAMTSTYQKTINGQTYYATDITVGQPNVGVESCQHLTYV